MVGRWFLHHFGGKNERKENSSKKTSSRPLGKSLDFHVTTTTKKIKPNTPDEPSTQTHANEPDLSRHCSSPHARASRGFFSFDFTFRQKIVITGRRKIKACHLSHTEREAGL